MHRKLIVYAPNINNGGGLILLWELISKFSNSIISHIFLDPRVVNKNSSKSIMITKIIKPNLVNRMLSQFGLFLAAKSTSIILCFGNLPPIFRLKGHVIVYLQNRYLVDSYTLKGHSFKAKLRIIIERKWLLFFQSHADEFIVQTDSMKILLEKKLKKKIPIKILPFHSLYLNNTTHKASQKKYDFIYVASGDPHKNHDNLLKAWCLLADDGHFPSLCLTVNEKNFPILFSKIQFLKDKYDLAITNLQVLPHAEIIKLYKQSSALIYPSLLESYGLPLIEACHLNIPIIAAELDYVRDVVSPDISFDPNSSLSIYRAVRRFLKIKNSKSNFNFFDYLTNQLKQ